MPHCPSLFPAISTTSRIKGPWPQASLRSTGDSGGANRLQGWAQGNRPKAKVYHRSYDGICSSNFLGISNFQAQPLPAIFVNGISPDVNSGWYPLAKVLKVLKDWEGDLDSSNKHGGSNQWSNPVLKTKSEAVFLVWTRLLFSGSSSAFEVEWCSFRDFLKGCVDHFDIMSWRIYYSFTSYLVKTPRKKGMLGYDWVLSIPGCGSFMMPGFTLGCHFDQILQARTNQTPSQRGLDGLMDSGPHLSMGQFEG